MVSQEREQRGGGKGLLRRFRVEGEEEFIGRRLDRGGQ